MKDEIRDNLVILLKMFDDKPLYLIKFLLENNAFTEEFLKKTFNSSDLNDLRILKKKDVNLDIISQLPHFKDINSMNDYFNHMINGKEKNFTENIYDKINKDLKETIIKDLKEALDNERYEEAAVIRDRMKKMNIKFKK